MGPASPEASLEARIARYISAPLSPVEVRELPCDVSFRDAPASEWQIGSATIRAEAVTHRGPTLGYRITDGRHELCYIPDHEPGLGADLADLNAEWISGYNLARDADLLIHDCQYTDEEYPGHEGWGHSPITKRSRSQRGSAPSGRCSSTTTPSTPTASSTTSTPRPALLGGPRRRPRADRDGHGGRRGRGAAAPRPAADARIAVSSSAAGLADPLPASGPGVSGLADRDMHGAGEFDRRYKDGGRSLDTGLETSRAGHAYLPTILKPRPPAACPAGRRNDG